MALDLPTLPSAVDLSTACLSSAFLSECNLGLANPWTLACGLWYHFIAWVLKQLNDRLDDYMVGHNVQHGEQYVGAINFSLS